MKEFKLELDRNTVYIKTIRFIGTLLMGFFIGAIFIKLRNGLEVDWMAVPGGFFPALFFAFFPGFGKTQSITINEHGFYTEGYAFHYGEQTKIEWEKIRSVRVEKGSFFTSARIIIKNQVGSTEKIPLPLFTKSQFSNLKTYLQEAASAKEVSYSA
jgi:hypothetical protein